MIKGVCYVVLFCVCFARCCEAYEVVSAVNCGGRRHVDSQGIEYQEDTSMAEGLTSNHGIMYSIRRVAPEDAPLYQSERYGTSSFSYTLNLNGDGKYLLVLKFCEVFFEAPNKKVFDVLLNDHLIVSELDLFQLVGHRTAHEEHIPFTVSRRTLFIRDQVSEIRGGRLKLTFAKGPLDNPKINAILLLKGSDVNAYPRLPSPSLFTKESSHLVIDEEGTADHFASDELERRPRRRTSGPKQPDPYELDSSLLPTVLFIVVAAIVPIAILRCAL